MKNVKSVLATFISLALDIGELFVEWSIKVSGISESMAFGYGGECPRSTLETCDEDMLEAWRIVPFRKVWMVAREVEIRVGCIGQVAEITVREVPQR